jgi:hypothetical protein
MYGIGYDLSRSGFVSVHMTDELFVRVCMYMDGGYQYFWIAI